MRVARVGGPNRLRDVSAIMETLLDWAAPVTTTVAALMVAANLGTRATGIAFIVYTLGALCWIGIGWLTNQPNLLIQNIILLVIDILGIWRWLGLRARYDKGAAVATERSGG